MSNRPAKPRLPKSNNQIWVMTCVRTQFVATPKLVLGSNGKGPNNKFVERRYKKN